MELRPVREARVDTVALERMIGDLVVHGTGPVEVAGASVEEGGSVERAHRSHEFLASADACH